MHFDRVEDRDSSSHSWDSVIYKGKPQKYLKNNRLCVTKKEEKTARKRIYQY